MQQSVNKFQSDFFDSCESDYIIYYNKSKIEIDVFLSFFLFLAHKYHFRNMLYINVPHNTKDFLITTVVKKKKYIRYLLNKLMFYTIRIYDSMHFDIRSHYLSV